VVDGIVDTFSDILVVAVVAFDDGVKIVVVDVVENSQNCRSCC